METRLKLDILPQPDDTTCGPTCLQAVYRYYDGDLPLDQLIREIPQLEGGGTLAVLLGCDALRRGFDATIYTYNVHVFDPTWFVPDAPPLADRLTRQVEAKTDPKLRLATQAYLKFLEQGGTIRMEDLTSGLLRRYLNRQTPILTGLSATYLYRSPREYGWNPIVHDDIRGVPVGHFVVLCGYDRQNRTVLVADPLMPNPLASGQQYVVDIDRVKNAILLGIITYDANLLIVKPKKASRRKHSWPS